MHQRHTVEIIDFRDVRRKKHYYKYIINIIVFEHKFAKSHLQLNFSENVMT